MELGNPYLLIGRFEDGAAVTGTAEVIMDIAERRIREVGHGGFSFREIAAEIGVKSASVHYHFPTKDSLVAAVARRYNNRIVEAIETKMAAGQDVVQAWREVFLDALQSGPNMCLCGSLGATSGELSQEVSDEVRRFFSLGTASLVSGGLTEERAIHVLATLEGAILMASIRRDATIFDKATKFLI